MPSLATASCKVGIKQSAKELFVHLGPECLLSSASGSYTFWSVVKIVSRDFCPSNPPFIYNCSDIVCEVFGSRVASDSALLNYPKSASFSNCPFFNLPLALGRSVNRCVLWILANHSVWTVFRSSSLKCILSRVLPYLASSNFLPNFLTY